MKLLAMSDIHDDWSIVQPIVELPDADVCVIAGDLTDMGVFHRHRLIQAYDVVSRLARRYSRVLWIPGNHDFGLDARVFRDITNVVCLLNGPSTIGGVLFRGVSLSVAYNMPSLAYTWCHMTTDPEVELRAFGLDECDVLVSHSPPFGVCDNDGYDLLTKQVCHIGSPALAEWCVTARPRLVICGHSHGGSGEGTVGGTRIVNVARRWELLELSSG